MANNKFLMIALSIILPPLAVYIASEGNDRQVFRTIISLILTIFFWAPGIFYAYDIVTDSKFIYPQIDKLTK
ncbi:YqaE/Pmp3 family membrane protein [Streptococcus dentiloxodontae]